MRTRRQQLERATLIIAGLYLFGKLVILPLMGVPVGFRITDTFVLVGLSAMRCEVVLLVGNGKSSE